LYCIKLIAILKTFDIYVEGLFLYKNSTKLGVYINKILTKEANKCD